MKVHHTEHPKHTLPFNEWAKYIREQTLPKACQCGICDPCIKSNLKKNHFIYGTTND